MWLPALLPNSYMASGSPCPAPVGCWDYSCATISGLRTKFCPCGTIQMGLGPYSLQDPCEQGAGRRD